MFFCSKNFQKRYFHDAHMSISWRLKWHSIRGSLSLSRQVYGPYNQTTVYTAC